MIPWLASKFLIAEGDLELLILLASPTTYQCAPLWWLQQELPNSNSSIYETHIRLPWRISQPYPNTNKQARYSGYHPWVLSVEKKKTIILKWQSHVLNSHLVYPAYSVVNLKLEWVVVASIYTFEMILEEKWPRVNQFKTQLWLFGSGCLGPSFVLFFNLSHMKS